MSNNMFYLVEIDEYGKPVQIATVDGKKEDFTNNPTWRVFETYDAAAAVMGKRWTGSEWEDVPAEPVTPQPPDTALTLLEGVADLSEQIDALKVTVAEVKTEARAATQASLAAVEGIAALSEANAGSGT